MTRSVAACTDVICGAKTRLVTRCGWSRIVAVVAPDPAAPELDTQAVRAAAGEHLARYKLPKAFVVVDRVQRSASGKPDYAWARRIATGEV